MDVIITGASRGIGRALALELASADRRLLLVARDAERLAGVESAVRERGGTARSVPGDLSTLGGAAALGATLAAEVHAGATLVHNAGVWPTRRETGPDGLERAFLVNFLGPMRMQAPLLAGDRLARCLVVGAGLMALGRVDAQRTPIGADFSRFRTYCTTKLCLAVATRDVAAAHPDVDFLVMHPGVVRTDLGDTPGVLGALVGLAKRLWEPPEVCAARLGRVLTRARWSPPGEARWMVEEVERPWPRAAESAATRETVRALAAR